MRDIIVIFGLVAFVYYCCFNGQTMQNGEKKLSVNIVKNEWLNNQIYQLQENQIVFFIKETISKGDTYYEIRTKDNNANVKIEIYDTNGNFQFDARESHYQNYQNGITYEKTVIESDKKSELGSI